MSQMRRAAVSVSTNVAEDSKRRTTADFAPILNVADRALAETEYLVQRSGDPGSIADGVVKPPLAKADDVARMLDMLRTKIVSEVC